MATGQQLALANDYADQYRAVIQNLLSGNKDRAIIGLKAIPNQEPILSRSSRTIAPARQLDVFQRDRFQCRYCGRRTIFLPVLRVLSALFPQEFPHHPATKMSECHIAYWRHLASCDHVLPIARGGSSEPDNLLTACYMCNSMKANWIVGELRWVVLPVANATWDGLTGAYIPLLELLGVEAEYHRKWSKAVQSFFKKKH